LIASFCAGATCSGTITSCRLTLITSILYGMVFCGSLCPFAAVQELLYNIAHRKSKKLQKPTLGEGLDRRGRYAKYIVLIAAWLVSVLLGHASAASLEPFLTLFTLKGTALGWFLVILTTAAALFHFRFWCRYLCPVGACLGLIARFSFFKIKLGKDCINCEICERACPTRAIRMDEQKLPLIDYPECILCGSCVRRCPKETLDMRPSREDEKRR
jgi:polyferredoxin